jgi:hypothetical protein
MGGISGFIASWENGRRLRRAAGAASLATRRGQGERARGVCRGLAVVSWDVRSWLMYWLKVFSELWSAPPAGNGGARIDDVRPN